MKYKFQIEINLWKKVPLSLSSNRKHLGIILEDESYREGPRFYYVYDIELSQNDSNSNKIKLNGWEFPCHYEIHDGQECFRTENVKEKFSIHALTPDGKDCTIGVNDTIKGLCFEENLINTLYAISLCKDENDARLISTFIHDRGCIPSYSYIKNRDFSLLLDFKTVIERIVPTDDNNDFVIWLKRLYNEKYKIWFETLANDKPFNI